MYHDRGLDYGAWTVIPHRYAQADIPVVQLSISATKGAQNHRDLAKEFPALRRKGVLIHGSVKRMHNPGMADWDRIAEPD